jgi:PAS domain S-box-containing protein
MNLSSMDCAASGEHALPSGMEALMAAYLWEATPLGDPSAWPRSLKAAVSILLGSRQPMFIVWGPQRAMLYNDAYAPILAARHPGALGRPFAQVWPDLAAEAGALMDRAFAGEDMRMEDLAFAVRRTGYSGEIQHNFSCSPIMGDGGAIDGLLWIHGVTAAQIWADRHLKFRLALNERLRFIGDPREVMAVTAEMLGRHLNASRANYGYVEDAADGEIFVVENDWTDGTAPSLVGRHRVESFGTALVDVLKAGHTVCLQDAFSHELTEGADIAATYVAIGARSGITVPLIREGRIAAGFLVHQVEPRHWREDEELLVRQIAEDTWDAVERARVETALRASEVRLRDIMESINDAFYAVDREWRFTYVNRRTEELWGRKREDLMGKVYWEEFPQAVGSKAYQAHVSAMERRAPVHLEAMSAIIHQWLDISIYPTMDGGLSVYFRNIADRKRAEEHRELLIHELNHRVKNTLATVQSIAAQTLRNAGVSPETKGALEERLFALSRAHNVLTRENWEGAALREIVAQAIEPYRGGDQDRLRSVGPDVRLAPRSALAVAMALQELATNALKHGSLSQAAGRVDINWSLDPKPNGVQLRLRWEESCGPVVQPPQRRGFGTRLIERSLAQDLGGEVTIAFPATGVVCIIDVPLENHEHSLFVLPLRDPAFAA